METRLISKGKSEPREGLVEQGRAQVALAKQYAAELAEHGFSQDDTAELDRAIATLESEPAVKVEGLGAEDSPAAAADPDVEADAISEAKAFVRRLRHSLPRVLRGQEGEGASGDPFHLEAPLRRAAPKIAAYLEKVRPSVTALDEKLSPHFKGGKATDALDAVKRKLDTVGGAGNIPHAGQSADTLAIYATKGRVLELIEDLNRAGRSAFDGQAEIAAKFNKDILLRARKKLRAEKEKKIPETAPQLEPDKVASPKQS